MHRNKTENFNDLAMINTMWDIQRLLQDKMAQTQSQAHWSDVPKPLELLKAAVAQDVLMHFADQLSDGMQGYDPAEEIELSDGSLRQVRQYVVSRFQFNTLHDIDDALEQIAEQRGPALFAPGFGQLGLANPVDQVRDMLEGESDAFARELVGDVYYRMRAGTPCAPHMAHTKLMNNTLDALSSALQPLLTAPPALIDASSPPAAVYADELADKARWHVEAILANVREGKTIAECDPQAMPSRLAGEMLADLSLSPILTSLYSTPQALSADALVLREIGLAVQVVEDHLRKGDLVGYALSDFQSRWTELHPGEPMADISLAMHKAACAVALDPFFRGAVGIISAQMLQSDNWQVEQIPDTAMEIAPKTSPLPMDLILMDHDDAAGDEGDNIDEQTLPPQEATVSDAEEPDVVIQDDDADFEDIQIAKAPTPTALLAQAVATNLMSDFARLSSDHLRDLDVRIITAETAEDKALQVLERDMAAEILLKMHDSVQKHWVDMARGGVVDRGDVSADALREIYLGQLSDNLSEQFDNVASHLRDHMTKDYLGNPAITTLMFFDKGFDAMESGALLARVNLNIIFSKLASGVPYAPEGQFAHSGRLSPECAEALDAVSIPMTKMFAHADKIFQQGKLGDKRLLNFTAHEVMAETVRAVMTTAHSADGRGQLAGLMIGPLGIVADPRSCDEEQPAYSAPALLLREVEIALDAVGMSLHRGSLKDKVMERYTARMDEKQRDVPFFSDDEYQKIIDPTIKNLGNLVQLLGNTVLDKDQVAARDASPDSIQIFTPGCRMQ